EPAPDEAEIACRGERRRDEHRGRAVVPQQLAEWLRDVDGRPDDRARLGPDHALELVGLEARTSVRGEPERASRERVESLAAAAASSRRWASSKMTASCSGRTPVPSASRTPRSAK